MKVLYNPDGTYKKTTHNNWFHNTFMGRQEYIDYGDRKVHLSESEFWQWQRSGSYENVGPVTDFVSNLELTLNESAANFADGVAKYMVSSAYSSINSPKVWLTGRSWAGTYATPDERAGGFIDVATQRLPAVHLLKQLHPGSWYKFKYANRHIPPRSRRVVYDVEKLIEVEKEKEVEKQRLPLSAWVKAIAFLFPFPLLLIIGLALILFGYQTCGKGLCKWTLLGWLFYFILLMFCEIFL